MKDKYVSKEDKLRLLMYAMTLSERKDSRKLWLSGKAFARLHQRGNTAMYDYWKKRLDEDPETEKLLDSEWLKFLDYIDNHQTYGYPKKDAALKQKYIDKEKYAKRYNIFSAEPGSATSAGEDGEPSLLTKAKSLMSAAKNLAQSGFKFADKELYESRLAICKGCVKWDAAAFGKTGKCTLCGCATQAKLRLPLENCPIGKWTAVNVQESQSSSSETPDDQSTQASQ